MDKSIFTGNAVIYVMGKMKLFEGKEKRMRSISDREKSSIIRNRHGTGYVFACVLIIAISMLISLLLLYSSCVNKVRGNKTYVSQTLDAYMSRYMMEHTKLMVYGDEIYSYIDVSELKQGALNAIGVGDGDKVTTSQGLTMSGIVAEYISGEQVGVKLSYDLFLPVRFLGIDFDNIKVKMSVRSRIVPLG